MTTIEERAAELLRFAAEIRPNCRTAEEFRVRLFGVDGEFDRHFVTREERKAAFATAELQRVWKAVARFEEAHSGPPAPHVRRLVLELPAEQGDALAREAAAAGVSVIRLALAKLSLPLDRLRESTDQPA